ncbi:hypothetical protein KSS87_012473 [Heliosperma pusillum]|nr:hypothetical protein KSS87_012473 [Heliosperma pusillum]
MATPSSLSSSSSSPPPSTAADQPTTSPLPPPSFLDQWKERIFYPTLLGGIVGGAIGTMSKHRKVHGIANMSATYATNFAIVSGVYCGVREFVRVTRKSEHGDLINSALGGFCSGAILGRLQGAADVEWLQIWSPWVRKECMVLVVEGWLAAYLEVVEVLWVVTITCEWLWFGRVVMVGGGTLVVVQSCAWCWWWRVGWRHIWRLGVGGKMELGWAGLTESPTTVRGIAGDRVCPGVVDGGQSGAVRYSIVFALVGTGVDYATLKLQPLAKSYYDSLFESDLKLPEWSPIQILDEEALAAKQAREEQLRAQRAITISNKES